MLRFDHSTMFAFRASSDDIDSFRLWRVDPLERGSNIISHHALRWDICLVESQERLEIKVDLKANLIGAPESVPWFYVDGECGGYGIECSVVPGPALVFGTCSLVPRGTLIPYSAAVSLVEGVAGITGDIRAFRLDTRFESLDPRRAIRVNCLNLDVDILGGHARKRVQQGCIIITILFLKEIISERFQYLTFQTVSLLVYALRPIDSHL
ncbi:hypothetical protein M9H77_03805 [Catharanthus roseus]|uniref:Uncharacterized protein n=1 Tax=Catharanthus roseus TaxID=4058 RepID=A0ACC0CCH1_CATRO|nr:hypothetical protein M9H77_03805 [Catharanthus roseus]